MYKIQPTLFKDFKTLKYYVWFNDTFYDLNFDDFSYTKVAKTTKKNKFKCFCFNNIKQLIENLLDSIEESKSYHKKLNERNILKYYLNKIKVYKINNTEVFL